MTVNKVIYNGRVLMDLTQDTIEPQALLKGYTAHDRSGKKINGTLEISGESGSLSGPLFGKMYKGTVSVGGVVNQEWDVYIKFKEDSIELLRKPKETFGVGWYAYLKSYSDGRFYIAKYESPVTEEEYSPIDVTYCENVARVMTLFDTVNTIIGSILTNLYIFYNEGRNARSLPMLPVEVYEEATDDDLSTLLLLYNDFYRGDLEYAESNQSEFDACIAERGWIIPSD